MGHCLSIRCVPRQRRLAVHASQRPYGRITRAARLGAAVTLGEDSVYSAAGRPTPQPQALQRVTALASQALHSLHRSSEC
jgi:hypothetical protein